MTAVMLGIVAAGLLIIKRWGERLPVGRKMLLTVTAAAFAQSIGIEYLTADEGSGSRLVLAVAGGCLLLASVTDYKTCQVYCFTWWPVYAVTAPGLWRMRERALMPLGIFFLVQFLLFQRLYGRADCHAFCVCAAMQATRGEGLMGFLVHMLTAWLMLALVQIVRGNMGKGGNLKQPVPFLPYITVAFWLVLVMECKYSGIDFFFKISG